MSEQFNAAKSYEQSKDHNFLAKGTKLERLSDFYRVANREDLELGLLAVVREDLVIRNVTITTFHPAQMLAETLQKVWGFLRGEVHVTVDRQPKAVILMRRTERGIVADVSEGKLPDYLESVLVGTWTSPQALASAIMKRVATHDYVEPPVPGIDPRRLKADAKTSISGQVRLKNALDATIEKIAHGIRNDENEEELERLFRLAVDLR